MNGIHSFITLELVLGGLLYMTREAVLSIVDNTAFYFSGVVSAEEREKNEKGIIYNPHKESLARSLRSSRVYTFYGGTGTRI